MKDNRNASNPSAYVDSRLGHPANEPRPIEPDLRSCARELFGYLCELGAVQSEARAGAFSPEPQELNSAARCDSPDESLEATLRRSCRMAACLVGEARTINAKLLG